MPTFREHFKVLYLSLLVYHAAAQVGDKTVQAPVVLPVRNETVNGNHVRRGMQMQYGTPTQNLAMAIEQ